MEGHVLDVTAVIGAGLIGFHFGGLLGAGTVIILTSVGLAMAIGWAQSR